MRFILLTILWTTINVVTAQAQQMPEAYYHLLSSIEQNDGVNSQFWADSCAKLKPQRYQYQLAIGQNYFNNKQYAQAIVHFSNAEKRKKNSAGLWLAKSHCMNNDTAQCFYWLRKHLESPQRSKESIILLDPTFDKLHSTASWKKLWETEWYNRTDKVIAEAEYYNQAGNYEETIELLNSNIKGSKSRYVLYGLRGDAFLALGNSQAAQSDYKIALKKSRKAPIYLVKLSIALANQNQYQTAINKIDEAIIKSGVNPKFCLEKAIIQYNNGYMEEAFTNFKYYLNFYPNSLKTMELFAQSAIESKNYVDALFALAKLIKLQPNNPHFRFLRGLALNKTEQPRLAIIDFDYSIQHDHKIAESYLQKGLANVSIGNTNEACACFSIAIQHGSFAAQELHYKFCNKK